MGLSLASRFVRRAAPRRGRISSRPPRGCSVATMLVVAASGSGCARAIPEGRSAVNTVDVEGNHEVSGGDIEEKLATQPSAKFLGLFRGVVFDYEIFDPAVLERDLERVQRFYRARGYYEARARAGRVIKVDEKHVRILIEVEEGEPVKVRNVTVRGIDELPPAVMKAVRAAAKPLVKPGDPFDEEPYVKAEAAVLRALTDHAYAYAKVKRSAEVDLPGHTADILFDVTPDKPARYGPVRVEGLGKLPEGPVRRALAIKEGATYSTAEIDASKQAILDLGVFSSVEIEPELPEPAPEEHIVPLTVKLTPTKLHRVRLGGGLELDVIKTDLHALIGWEHRNFLGGMRSFRVDFRPGVVLYPTRLPDFQAPTHFLPEEKLHVEFRQPGFIEARTNGIVRSDLDFYPVILSPKVDKSAPVIGYREAKAAVGMDRVLWKLYGAIFYDIQQNVPFIYVGEKDPTLRPILLSYIDLITHFDYRNDTVHPHKGIYLANDLQIAGGPLGGSARDVRVLPEARGYVPLAKKVTFALRGTAGVLIPSNYGGTLEENAAGNAISEADRARWARDVQIVFFRGFFSGGPSSNRGYPIRGVGPHGVIPFFNPGVAATQLARRCDKNDPEYDEARCLLPLGGLSLWEASAELRFPMLGPLTGATFCDSSDVAPRKLQYRFDRPHLSCGFGARYDTPVGPIRLDIGYRLPGMQVLGSASTRGEGNPGTIFGAPVAIAFGIGEAF
jgi:outer membrane protein assembly factor BamA